MAKSLPKRFYDNAEAVRVGNAFHVQLDGRTLKTPGKLTLSVRDEHVAELIAAEWRSQDKVIDPETMPVTRLVNVSLEITPDKRPELVAEARKYASTDVLCYRDPDATALFRHQSRHWDPLLDWGAEQGISLRATDSVLAIDQEQDALDRVADYTARFDDLHLTLFVHLIAVFGSAVLAMAVMEKHLSGLEAFELSRLDAAWQAQQWGEDEEAMEAVETLRTEVVALCNIIGDKDG